MNIYDIAAEAGVSISTVSRVLNNPEKVALSTRESVNAVLKKHNYIPNEMARGLVFNSMKTIGVLVPDIQNLHYSTVAYVLENLFFNWDYNTLLCNTGDDIEKKKKYIRILASKKVDGLVLLGSVFSDPEIEQLISRYFPSTPVITSNSCLNIPNSCSVLIDHMYGMELAVAHLVERGHTDICFIRCNDSYNTQRKISGFLQAIEKRSLPIDKNRNIYFSEPGPKGGGDFADQILPQKKPFTAFIFMDDYTAVGAVNRFKKSGLRIPQDIAVIGHDNSVYALCSEPGLTSVDTKIERMSAIMANTLHDIFLKEQTGDTIVLRPELVVREST